MSRSPSLLFRRHPQNPILTAEMWPYPVHSVFNPAATLLPDGATLLLCRVEDRRGHSHLCVARSPNGLDHWRIDSEPTLTPDLGHPEELWGLEDPRITYVNDLKQYAIAYTAYSPGGPGVALALTPDFHRFERLGVVMPPEDKDAALLPRRVGDCWAMLHRPVSVWRGAHIWISYSPDLRHWGSHKLILEARQGGWWDANKIGLSPPPIETPEGWLILYHGVRHTAAGCIYRLGMALFDLETPERCLRRGNDWVFGPEEPYERFGDVGNVVFPCGFTIGADGDTLRLYYGCADTCIGLATASIRALLDWLKKSE
ncbi:MAG: glycosidase [Planctomycetota bacterium]